MNLAAAWRARVSGPSRPELEQALLRVVVLSIVTLWVLSAFLLRVRAGDDRLVVTSLVGWLILAIAIFVAIWIWPAPNMPRRIVGMLADAGAITFGLFFMGSGGAVLVGAYLFIIIGNGFRYGRIDLHICQGFCLAGLTLVAVRAEWWEFQRPVIVGWMTTLIALPFYIGALSHRMRAALAKAEQTLAECIGREGSGS